MPITVQSEDGRVHVFPDNAPVDDINAAMKQYAAEKPGVLSRMATGFMDPIYGAAQIGARMPEEGFTADPAAAEEQRQQRIKTVDTMVKDREREYQAKRGPNDGMDVARMVGSVPSTAVLSVPGMLVGGIPGAIVAGATGGALQPATSEDFGSEKAGQIAMGGTAGGVLGVAGKGLSMGVRALGDYLAREFPENVATQAIDKILKRFGQDAKAGGLTAQQALDVVNEANGRGTPLNLADVGGENVRALAGNVAREPGASRNIATTSLNARDRGAAQRLGRDINEYVHGGPSMERTTGALLEARSAEARPLWDEVRQMQGVWSPRLQQFFEDPAVRSGMARGYEIERLESLAEGREFNPTQMGIDLDAEGNVLIRQTPNMRVIHMAKMGLDAAIASERNEITGRLSQRGVALDRVRRAYLQEIDSLDTSGIYRQARAAWEGPSASMDAVRAGRVALQSSPEEIAAELGGLSPANQEFYRLGVADAIRERLAKTGLSGDEAKSIIKNQWMRDQLRSVFRSDADFDAFAQSVTWEGEMFGTKRSVLGGSDTARRLAEDQSGENLLAAGGAEIAEKLARGSWLGTAKTAIRMWRDLGIRPNPAVNEEVARILFGSPINPASETGRRLTGQFTGPKGVNHLGGAADALNNVGSWVSPGAAAALDQPGMPQ